MILMNTARRFETKQMPGTAKATYASQIRRLNKQIGDLAAIADRLAKQDGANWNHVGSVTELTKRLGEALSFIEGNER